MLCDNNPYSTRLHMMGRRDENEPTEYQCESYHAEA